MPAKTLGSFCQAAKCHLWQEVAKNKVSSFIQINLKIQSNPGTPCCIYQSIWCFYQTSIACLHALTTGSTSSKLCCIHWDELEATRNTAANSIIPIAVGCLHVPCLHTSYYLAASADLIFPVYARQGSSDLHLQIQWIGRWCSLLAKLWPDQRQGSRGP